MSAHTFLPSFPAIPTASDPRPSHSPVVVHNPVIRQPDIHSKVNKCVGLGNITIVTTETNRDASVIFALRRETVTMVGLAAGGGL